MEELSANTELVPWNFWQVESEFGQEIILNSSMSGHFSLIKIS